MLVVSGSSRFGRVESSTRLFHPVRMMRRARSGCSIEHSAEMDDAELPTIGTPSEDEIVAEYEDRLRSLALSDEGFI